MEAHPSLYTRELVNVERCVTGREGGVGGEVVQCWAYLVRDYRPALLSLPLLHQYCSAATPWDPRYLEHKDGTWLYNQLKQPPTGRKENIRK